MNLRNKNQIVNMNTKNILQIPYNENNVLVRSNDIINILKKFDIKIEIKNLCHYQEALTHKSYIKKEYFNIHTSILKQEYDKFIQNNIKIIDLQESSNERLEFLGDTFIKCIIAKYLYKRFYLEDEGFMTKLKTKLEDTKSLAKYARRLGLEDYILVSKQIDDNNGRNADKILEDTFESFIGALYLDQGYDACDTLINILLETEIDYAEILSKDTNFKDRLLRFYDDNKWSCPKYILIKEEMVMNKKLYTMGVTTYDGSIIAQATDTSKKEAEQRACALALIKFNLISEDQMKDIEI